MSALLFTRLFARLKPVTPSQIPHAVNKRLTPVRMRQRTIPSVMWTLRSNRRACPILPGYGAYVHPLSGLEPLIMRCTSC